MRSRMVTHRETQALIMHRADLAYYEFFRFPAAVNVNKKNLNQSDLQTLRFIGIERDKICP